MAFSFPIILLAALVPPVLGFVWYNPKVFGTAWMKHAGLSEEQVKGSNFPLLMALTYISSVFISVALVFIVIHQNHLYSMLADVKELTEDPSAEVSVMVKTLIEKYGNNFRTFKHGAFHGLLSAFTLATPFIAISAIRERRSFYYILIHSGFWFVCLALMGGILCQFS